MQAHGPVERNAAKPPTPSKLDLLLSVSLGQQTVVPHSCSHACTHKGQPCSLRLYCFTQSHGQSLSDFNSPCPTPCNNLKIDQVAYTALCSCTLKPRGQGQSSIQLFLSSIALLLIILSINCLFISYDKC